MDSLNQASADSLILGNCLNCQGLVRVPLRAAANSKVRCPHCSNEYRLSEILEESVPALEIVEEATERLEMEEPDLSQKEVFVIPPQLAEGALRKRERRTENDQLARNSDSRRGKSGYSSSRKGRGSRKKSRKRLRIGDNLQRRFRGHSPAAKKAKSPILEFIKVVVGGLMAIPIAYAIVLWGFDKDPLNVGPQVSEYVPFVIPADFQFDIKSNLDAKN